MTSPWQRPLPTRHMTHNRTEQNTIRAVSGNRPRDPSSQTAEDRKRGFLHRRGFQHRIDTQNNLNATTLHGAHIYSNLHHWEPHKLHDSQGILFSANEWIPSHFPISLFLASSHSWFFPINFLFVPTHISWEMAIINSAKFKANMPKESTNSLTYFFTHDLWTAVV